MQIKETKKLFYGKYQHKLVLVTPLAFKFRHKNLDELLKIYLNYMPPIYSQSRVVTEIDVAYAKKIAKQLLKIKDYSLRIENPWLSVYSNSQEDLLKLAKINEDNTKYLYIPKVNLKPDQIVMSDMPFDFKVTVGIGFNDLSFFTEWAANNEKFRIPKFSQEMLSKSTRYMQSYFYVKDEKNLLLAKMHLGRNIQKIETILNKADIKA